MQKGESQNGCFKKKHAKFSLSAYHQSRCDPFALERIAWVCSGTVMRKSQQVVVIRKT